MELHCFSPSHTQAVPLDQPSNQYLVYIAPQHTQVHACNGLLMLYAIMFLNLVTSSHAATRTSVLKIDAHGYALVMERRGTTKYKATDADEAWKYQQAKGYAPLTPTRKSRSSRGSEQGSFPSPIPQDYEVPVSLPSPRLVRQKRLSSQKEEPEDVSDHVFSEEQEEEEELMEQNLSTVELLQADELRTAEATSVDSVVPSRPRAKTFGAQETCAAYREGTQSQRKSLPSTLHICLNQESSVVI